MIRGTIKFINEDDHYGFVQSRSLDEDLFFNTHDVHGDPAEGAAVKFSRTDIAETKRGPRLQDLTIRQSAGR